MEQARYWMWTSRRYTQGSDLIRARMPTTFAIGASSYNESWEEQAFAEDAAGHLGGCVWPPRSYSCSFCRREFRSAQALGGHMNVHRRDRARLKQSSSPTVESLETRDHMSLCTVVTGTQYQPQVASLVYGTSTNPNPNSGVAAATQSPGISVQSTLENWNGVPVLVPSFSSTRNNESKRQEPRVYAMAGSFEDAIPLELHMGPELKLGRELTLASKVELCGLKRRREPEEEEEEGDDELISCSKRKRIDTVIFSVMEQPPSDDQLKTLQSEVLDPKPIEELDLELRLGDAPKFK